MVTVNGVKEFLESSTIHGLSYIAGNRGLVRLFWICVVIAGFTGSFILIHQSYTGWEESPISTTIETLPISDIDFPNVTVCPPKNSFTSLIPDLVRSRNITFTEEQGKTLSEFINDALYEANANAKYAEFSAYRKNTGAETYVNSYAGVSNISLPYIDHTNDNKFYGFQTAALSGSFSTPYFGQPFDDSKFEQEFESEVYIYVSQQIPDGGYLFVDIEYDIGELSKSEYVLISEQPFDYTTIYYVNGDYEILAKTRDGHVIKKYDAVEYKQSAITSFVTSTWEKIDKRIYVKYYRNIYDQYLSWKTKRNTGMRVSWHYEPAPEPEVKPDDIFVGDNKIFIHLANIIHQHNGPTEDMEDLVKAFSKEKQKEEQTQNSEMCRNVENEKVISKKYENISSKPIHSGEISEESLEIAARLYHRIVFCPYYDPLVVKFYGDLMENFPLETILKTLARVLLVAKEKELTEHYQTAKAILTKVTTMMNLQYREIAVMTTGATELELYQELNDYHLNYDSGRGGSNKNQSIKSKTVISGFSNLEGLINHPAHISDTNGLSAFIPFCSFGTKLTSGEQLNNFQGQFCSLFTEKIVDGQVCYEADINQFKNKLVPWDKTLQNGLRLIIDTNDEYDVKNILEKKSPIKRENFESFDPFKNTEDESSFTILLKTISKIFQLHSYYCLMMFINYL